MKQGLRVLVVLLALTSLTASAQDARAVLQASAAAMGLNSVKTIQYTATGWNALVGQSFNLEEDWPRFEVTAYSRTIDYDANVSREDFTRRRGNYPMRGGGAPFDGDQRVVQIVSGGYAWNMQGEKPALPGRPYLEVMPHNELRQLEIILTPHGFLKAAMASTDARVMSTAIVGPTNAGLTENGRRANLVAFTALGKYKVVGTINDQNLVELTTTWIPNAVYGDMVRDPPSQLKGFRRREVSDDQPRASGRPGLQSRSQLDGNPGVERPDERGGSCDAGARQHPSGHGAAGARRRPEAGRWRLVHRRRLA
jgi:hypothetical protein